MMISSVIGRGMPAAVSAALLVVTVAGCGTHHHLTCTATLAIDADDTQLPANTSISFTLTDGMLREEF